MGIQEQLKQLKENWLMLAILIVILLVAVGGDLGSMTSSMDHSYAERSFASEAAFGKFAQADFAPEIEERKIIKSTTLSSEVKRGSFSEEEDRLKSIVDSSDSFILSENVNKRGERGSFYGSYEIKVETDKYDSVISQLKEIGEITSFNENEYDVTGSYSNTQINLEVEAERLRRYQELYDETTSVTEKLELNDRLFDQERRVAYLKESLENTDSRIEYTSIHFSLREKESEYANIALVKLSGLVKSFVGSLNTLLGFLVVVIPWAVAFLIVRFIWRRVKRA